MCRQQATNIEPECQRMNIKDYMGNKWNWNQRQWQSVGCKFVNDSIDSDILYVTEDDNVYYNTLLYIIIHEMKKKNVYEVYDGWVNDVISKSMYQDNIVAYIKKRVYARTI